MKYLTKLTTAIIFVISGCATSQSYITDINGNPTWAAKYKAPAIYEMWWQQIAECENLPLPPQHKDVVWLMVAKRPFRLAGDSTHTNVDGVALTNSEGVEQIYINYTGVVNAGLVKHEQLHKLLLWKFGKVPTPAHLPPYYEQCGMVASGQQDYNGR